MIAIGLSVFSIMLSLMAHQALLLRNAVVVTDLAVKNATMSQVFLHCTSQARSGKVSLQHAVVYYAGFN